MSTYTRLRADILAGKFPPGEALGEIALGKLYGTSRTPVREALQRLESDLLVERSSRGMRVRESTPEEILDIYEVRIDLEGLAARLAAHRRTELDLARIRTAHETMISETEADVRAEKNRRFHETIWASGHNLALVDQLERLNLHLARYNSTTLAVEGRWESALAEHRDIVAAIADHDAERAGALAEEHMSRAREVRLRLYAEQH